MSNFESDSSQRMVDISLIRTINKSITSRSPLPDLLESILDVAKTMIEAESSSLLLAEKESGDLIFNIVIGEKGKIIKGERVPSGKGVAGIVAKEGKPLIVNDAQGDSRIFKEIDEKSGYETRNIICVPMIVMEQLVGVLEIVNSIDRDNFDDMDLEKAKYIAEQAAIAIMNRMLYDDLEKRIDELSALFDVSNAISFASQDDDILQKIIESLAQSLGVDRASICVYCDESKNLILEAATGISDFKPGEIYIDIDESISGHVFKNSEPLVISNIEEELPASLQGTFGDYQSNSFISVPIFYKNKTIGVVNLADKEDRGIFDSFDMRVLSTAGSQIAETYQNVKNIRNQEEQRRLAQEIDIAAQIQKRILPVIPLTYGNQRMAAFNEPAKLIGGDFYDFYPSEDGSYSVLVADISGKGIPAALFMGSVRNILRVEQNLDYHPANLLRNSNRFITQESEYGMFVTVFYAHIDQEKGEITFGSAGHNNQFLVRKDSGEITCLNARGKPLGLLDDQTFEEKTVTYSSGDLLVLFTDGVVECLGGPDLDTEKGEKELAKISARHIEYGPDILVKKLSESVKDAPDNDLRDDFTVMAIQL